MNKKELLKKIQQLSFAKTEAELFLDTHPTCQAALDYYKQIMGEWNAAAGEYENQYGPLTAAGVTGDTWSWIDGPWPWHLDTDENSMGTGGGCQGGCQGERARGRR